MWVEEEILILPFYMYLDSALSGIQKVVQARKCTVLGSTKCVHCKRNSNRSTKNYDFVQHRRTYLQVYINCWAKKH
jgi:hypothetical protein